MEPDMKVHVAVKLQAQRQQFFVGQVESVAFSTRNRLEHQVFQKPAVAPAAEADAPRNAATGMTGQPQGTLPKTDRLIVKEHHGQLFDVDQSVDERAIGQVAQGGEWPGPGTAASAAEAMTPLVQRRRL